MLFTTFQGAQVVLVQEWCLATLADVLRAATIPLPPMIARFVAFWVFQAVAHLAEQGRG